MISIWEPCKCGGDPVEIERINVEDIICIIAKCKKCKSKFVDSYQIKYNGRVYTGDN